MRIEDVVLTVLRQWTDEDGTTAEDINDGNCEAFADAVTRLVPGAVMMMDEEQCHWFIKCGDRYYDSERPQGTMDYHTLPCIRRDRVMRERVRQMLREAVGE